MDENDDGAHIIACHFQLNNTGQHREQEREIVQGNHLTVEILSLGWSTTSWFDVHISFFAFFQWEFRNTHPEHGKTKLLVKLYAILCVCGRVPLFSLCLCTIHQLIASDTYITFVFLLRLLLCCASWISGAIYLWRAVLIRISTCWTLHENYFRSLSSSVKYLKAASFSMCTNMNYLHFHVSARDIQLPQLNRKHRFQMNLLEKPNERTKKMNRKKQNKLYHYVLRMWWL